MTEQKLNTQAYKGARDFYPADMRVRNYIFSTWKRVAVRFGFEEYDFPILEPLEIFAAKTGDIGLAAILLFSTAEEALP